MDRNGDGVSVFFSAIGIAAIVIVLLLAIGWLSVPDAQADEARYEAGYAAGHAAGVQEGGQAARAFKCRVR
jgi:hypothetical protein